MVFKFLKRKIIIDTYGGWGAHGGGAFSGKDPTKIDRSGAYMARWIAKSIVFSDLAKRVLIQISYSIGIAKPLSININTYGTSTISENNLLKIIDKKRLLIPLPIFIARLSAKFFQLFPKPLLTLDQLNLLKYDNVASGKYKNNFDIGIPSVRMFDIEVEKYAFMWKDAGQFSSKKHNLN